ncbi:MAG: hypothetical protein ABGZ23_03895 [Fuerstiella sp.]
MPTPRCHDALRCVFGQEQILKQFTYFRGPSGLVGMPFYWLDHLFRSHESA